MAYTLEFQTETFLKIITRFPKYIRFDAYDLDSGCAMTEILKNIQAHQNIS